MTETKYYIYKKKIINNNCIQLGYVKKKNKQKKKINKNQDWIHVD